MDKPARRPQLGAPDYNLSAFRHDMLGGGLRWLATILAVAAAVVVCWTFLDPHPPDIPWPVHLSGVSAKVASALLLVFWSIVAAANWRSRVVARRGTPAAG